MVGNKPRRRPAGAALQLEGGGEQRPEGGRGCRRRQRRSVLRALSFFFFLVNACVVEWLQAMDGKQLG